MSELIHIGGNAVAINMTGEYIIVDDDTGRIVILLSDAPAVAAAISKLAGEPDPALAVVERLIEAGTAMWNGIVGEHGRRVAEVNFGTFDAAITAARDWRAKQGDAK